MTVVRAHREDTCFFPPTRQNRLCHCDPPLSQVAAVEKHPSRSLWFKQKHLYLTDSIMSRSLALEGGVFQAISQEPTCLCLEAKSPGSCRAKVTGGERLQRMALGLERGAWNGKKPTSTPSPLARASSMVGNGPPLMSRRKKNEFGIRGALSLPHFTN